MTGAAAMAAPAVELLTVEMLRQDQDPREPNAEPEAPEVTIEATPQWVAAHRPTQLWDGPDGNAPSRGRLPAGSYFLVLGAATPERVPVSFSGNRSIAARDGWLDLRDVGPISAPAADWTQPDFPARRLTLGQRGEVVRGDPDLPLIALTFDAGAGDGSIRLLLDVLRDRGVKSTFFVAGAFAARYPDIVARIAAEGHELANHSYTHPDFKKLTEAEMRSETRRATAAIEAASGARIVPLWRPPFGSRDDRILRVMEEEGFRSIYWTFDSGDWIEGTTTDRVRSAVLRQAVAGAIVVHHVSPLATAQAMPDIVDQLRARGFDFTTVSELIGQ
jgi:peptidoglycan/xylan/chitin deacetylase (PgdA/CDA1 family)